jgi:hypothetical protein
MPEVEPITREEKLWSGEDIEPITREEQYIKHIYDKTQTIPSKPITRKEMLLEKAGEGGGSDVTIKQLSVTANGTYSEENTAYSPVIVNVPAPPIPDNAYLLNEVEGLPKDIVTFTDGASLPMPSLKIGIEPQQDLHGYDSPWVGGAGKNKFNASALSPLATDGITATVSNGEITFNGTATNNAFFSVYGLGLINSSGFALSFNNFDTNSGVHIACRTSDGTYFIDSNANGVNKTSTSSTTDLNAIIIYVESGTQLTNFKIKPQVEFGQTPTPWTPYSNICPISGHTEANVVVSPTTDAEDGTTYNIKFKDGSNPLTVYGSTLDVVSGELKVVPYYASYNGETLEGEWISDRDVYAVGTTPTIGAQVVNIGATPITYQLTPTQVKSLLGTNNVWADTGDIEELEYFSKEA